eukprot:1193627-Prorocentrum_minimum.AAC.1
MERSGKSSLNPPHLSPNIWGFARSKTTPRACEHRLEKLTNFILRYLRTWFLSTLWRARIYGALSARRDRVVRLSRLTEPCVCSVAALKPVPVARRAQRAVCAVRAADGPMGVSRLRCLIAKLIKRFYTAAEVINGRAAMIGIFGVCIVEAVRTSTPLLLRPTQDVLTCNLETRARVYDLCSLPSCDWFRRREYALFPHAIGSECSIDSARKLPHTARKTREPVSKAV